MIRAGLVAALNAAIAAAMDRLAVPRGANPFLGTETCRIFNLLAQDPAFAAIPVHDAVLAVVEQVLDDELLLSSLTAVETHPGQAAQPCIPTTVPCRCPAPIRHLPWWRSGRSPTSRLTGPPGSHRFDRRLRPGEVTAWSRRCRRGAVLIYDGEMWDGGRPNRSDAARRMVI